MSHEHYVLDCDVAWEPNINPLPVLSPTPLPVPARKLDPNNLKAMESLISVPYLDAGVIVHLRFQQLIAKCESRVELSLHFVSGLVLRTTFSRDSMFSPLAFESQRHNLLMRSTCLNAKLSTSNSWLCKPRSRPNAPNSGRKRPWSRLSCLRMQWTCSGRRI